MPWMTDAPGSEGQKQKLLDWDEDGSPYRTKYKLIEQKVAYEEAAKEHPSGSQKMEAMLVKRAMALIRYYRYIIPETEVAEKMKKTGLLSNELYDSVMQDKKFFENEQETIVQLAAEMFKDKQGHKRIFGAAHQQLEIENPELYKQQALDQKQRKNISGQGKGGHHGNSHGGEERPRQSAAAKKKDELKTQEKERQRNIKKNTAKSLEVMKELMREEGIEFDGDGNPIVETKHAHKGKKTDKTPSGATKNKKKKGKK
ncbi:hypothetical protein, variant [Sphaeroforma arctica JP610]|nr:hypothetical protein, variant [Sphaeroforma arctica JP610]KNC78204.1 hypothetical protein, variant [Sphaeroforma arctica JP610]|eukprot:XP_014152106.1 hypothetical protein, variant [Sphaeroforma arctica JP610]